VHKIDINKETNEITPFYSDNTIIINEDIDLIIKKRLSESMNSSRAFEAQISDRNDDSVYSIIGKLYNESDENFVVYSKNIVDKLISCQKAKNIPGGHLIICEGEYNVDSSPLYIYSIFKTESHDAVTFNPINNELNLLRDILLSPAQKLYKIGFFAIGSDIELSHVFDTSINSNYLPAKYFYNNFLGLNLESNDKIKTATFYQAVEDFIYKKVNETDEQIRLITLLNSEVFNKSRPAIEPDFLKNDLKGDILSYYLANIADQFGNGFIKNIDLIQQKEKIQRITIVKGITLLVSDEMMSKIKFTDSENSKGKIVTINE
jgi:hypothetical protein